MKPARIIRAIGAEFADMWRDGISGKVVATIIVGCLLFIIGSPFLLVADAKDLAEWRSWCAAQGDTRIEISKDTKLVPAGKTAIVTTETTHVCLSSDGRVLDTRD